EEEGLVPALIFRKHDRTAGGKAELVLVERRSDDLSRLVLKCRIQVEEVPRLNRIVAIDLVRGTLKLIGSRLRDQVDLPACALSKLGRIVAGLDLELLQNIDRRPKVEQVVELITIDGPVQQKAVLFRPRSCDRDAAAG